MKKKFFFLSKTLIPILILLNSNNVNSLLSKVANTQLEPSNEKNSEVGGSVFDDLGIPNEEQSQELNDESNESGDNSIIADNNFDPFKKEHDEEEKELAQKEAERLAKLKAEEERKKKEEEEKKKKEEEERKKKEEEEKKKKEEEEKKKKEEEEEKEKLEKEKKEKEEEERKKKEEEEKKEKEEKKEEEEEEEEKESNTIKLNNTSPLLKTSNNSNEDTTNSSLIYKVHHPALDIDKSTKTKIWSISTIIIFGFAYLILRLLYNKLKNLNKFFSKCIASLSNQLLFLIMCYIIIILIYTYGNFDSIPLNWEYFIAGIAIYLITYVIFSIYIIVICYFITKKWEKLEKNATSFTDLRHKFDNIANQKYYPNNNNYNESNTNDIIESFEYLVLKRFFFIPLFPIFKASSFRKEMNFSIYLKKSLIEKLRLYFKFSWTSWFILLVTIMFWNVFISGAKAKTLLFLLIILPIIGILITALIYIYCKSIYRKVVEKISQNNIANYQDVDYNSNSALQSLSHPKYLLNLIQDEKEMEEMNKPDNFHIHFHQRPSSLYENLIPFGISGFHILINIIQSICLIFICWGVITFGKHLSVIREKYNKLGLILFIIGSIVYFFIQGFISAFALKWYCIIDSIEMRRNEKCVKKMINHHLYHSGKIAESIFQNFKKIYFDMKINKEEDIEDQIFIDQEKKNELELGYPHLQEMIRTCVYRYTKSEDEKVTIDIEKDLIPFLKTLGNNLTENEIEFMLHLIQNFHSFKGQLSIINLFNIYGAILHFRKQNPLEIIKFVMSSYYKSNKSNNKSRETYMTYNAIESFVNTYHKFFTKEENEFIKEQCSYLGESFTLDALMINILSLRQYYPY